MAKTLQEEHFGINGENYEMLNTAKVIAEGDYVGEQFIDDVYEYTLSSQDIVVANEVVTNEWFNNLATLPQNKQKALLNEWLKLGIFEYIMNSGVTSAVRDILTPKEYSDLLHIMKNGRALEAECMRLAYKLSAVYQDDLYMWYADNFGSFNESLEEGIDAQDLSFKINKKVVTFYSDGKEVSEYNIATISNMTDKDLFDVVYLLAEQNVPNIKLLDVADFAVMLQMEVAKVLNKGGDVLESIQGLTEDEPQVENPQQFDVMGDIVNGNNIAAEKRFDSNQNQDTQEFDNDGDMKVSTGKKAGTSELDDKIANVAGVKPDDVDDVIVKKITNFDELTTLAIGETKTPLDELCVYEIYNLNVSELVFYLIVDLPENQCIVNIIDQDGECLTELTQQLVDYALSTQLDAYGDYHEGVVDDDVPVEESLLSEDGGVYAAQENIDIGQAAEFPDGDDDMFAGTGAIIDVSELGNQEIDTSDPELAFDVEILTNDDGSVSIVGNVPAVINALGGVQAEQIKGDLIGDAEDSYNKENNPTAI